MGSVETHSISSVAARAMGRAKMRRSYAHLFCHKTFSFLGERLWRSSAVYQRFRARTDAGSCCSLISLRFKRPRNSTFNMYTYIFKNPRPRKFLPLFPITYGSQAGGNAFHAPGAFLRNRNPTAATSITTPHRARCEPGFQLQEELGVGTPMRGAERI